MNCKYCRQVIQKEDQHYYSRQAGMQGDYHWSCFVEACRKANKAGQQEIDTIMDYNIVATTSIFDYEPSPN